MGLLPNSPTMIRCRVKAGEAGLAMFRVPTTVSFVRTQAFGHHSSREKVAEFEFGNSPKSQA
jgi:hypothetical protein